MEITGIKVPYNKICFTISSEIVTETTKPKKESIPSKCFENNPINFFSNVVKRCAKLAASYHINGFVHGVLNTDNINVTGESFDYGPYRFMEKYDPQKVAAYFDHSGLYKFSIIFRLTWSQDSQYTP